MDDGYECLFPGEIPPKVKIPSPQNHGKCLVWGLYASQMVLESKRSDGLSWIVQKRTSFEAGMKNLPRLLGNVSRHKK